MEFSRLILASPNPEVWHYGHNASEETNFPSAYQPWRATMVNVTAKVN